MRKYEFARYEVYKDSDVEWIGEFPDHWKMKRIKEIAEINKRTLTETTPRDYEFDYVDIGSVTYGVKGFSTQRLTFDVAPSRARRIVQKGDIIISTVRTYLKAITSIDDEVSDLVVSTGFAVISLNNKLSSKYFSYIFKSESIIAKISALSSGVSYPATNSTTIGNQICIVPPILEQKAIADYLDVKTTQIDRKIDLLTQKAAKYGELKQSLINETVTRGLDKTVAMKDSGVEWIGDVPEHWEVKRLKDLSIIQNSNVDKISRENEIPVRLCNYVDVYKNDYINSSLHFMHATADKLEIKRFSVKKNDVYITKDSETSDDIAIPAFATETIEGVVCGYHLAQIRTNEKVLLGLYLFRLFQSKRYGFRYVISSKGITRVGLGLAAITDSLTPVPPINEQQAIADYLDAKTAHIDRIIDTINAQIEKLKELRKTLINDVVIGKIKVYQGETAPAEV